MNEIVTVQEVFDYAIESDMLNMAHHIFWALSKGHVTAQCAAEKLQSVEYNEQEISSMIQSNLLSIGKIKLFVIQTQQANSYAFYYAENSLAVYSMHQQLFREKPKKVTNANHLLQEIFEFVDTGTSAMLYEHRRKIVEYPYYLGHAYAGERVLQRLSKGMIA